VPAPAVAVVVPTRGRSDSLQAALATIVPQARAAGGEVVVVDDAGANGTGSAFEAVRVVTHPHPLGPNAARNTGILATTAPLIVLTEDDIEVPEGWLATLLAAADAAPDVEVFGGPIRGRVDGPWRQCGREWPPISSLDRGPADRDVDLVYAGNMLVRRSAIERIGPFADSLGLYGAGEASRRVAGARDGSAPAAGFYGDEEEWQERYRAAGGRIRYIAAARVDHVRRGEQARLPALARAAYARGRVARRWAASRGTAPPLPAEARVAAGAVAHALRFRCFNGWLWTATAAGRTAEALTSLVGRSPHGRATSANRSTPATQEAPPYLAPGSGLVTGRRAIARARAADLALDLRAAVADAGLRGRARLTPPRRRVLVLGIERTDVPGLWRESCAELLKSRHTVTIRDRVAGRGGKFENLNAMLGGAAPGHDWLLVVDDDVALPPHFLDRFLHVAERHGFALAQPAHRLDSYAAWPVTRRRPAAARETRFVEIGPVTAFRADTFATLLPFPPLKMGWGLDAHWSAVARAKGWRIGIVDATPIRHGLRRTGSGYDAGAARAEAAAFLQARPYVTRDEAAIPVATHRR
jgi:GT2 family glycosyltransferase